MTTVCETLGVARSNIAESVKRRPSKARGRPPLADRELVDEIKTIIDDMPTYGYRRVHAILCRRARSESRPWPNAKRVYRVMKVHGMILQRPPVPLAPVATMAVLPSSNPICAGVQTASRSAATTRRRSTLSSHLTDVTAKPFPKSHNRGHQE
jgi:transposase InsO family protein